MFFDLDGILEDGVIDVLVEKQIGGELTLFLWFFHRPVWVLFNHFFWDLGDVSVIELEPLFFEFDEGDVVALVGLPRVTDDSLQSVDLFFVHF